MGEKQTGGSTGTFVSWKALSTISGAAAVVVALVLNIAGTAQHSLKMAETQSTELVTQSKELHLMRAELASLRTYINDKTKERYTEGDAARDLNYINLRLERLEAHVQKEIDRAR